MQWTASDFDTYRANYGMMLDVVLQNPIIPNVLNNVARPSLLEGFAKTIITTLSDNLPLLMQTFVSLLESEFVFVATHKEPFIFLRERSRIASRATGDYVIQHMKPVVRLYFKDIVESMYPFKLKDSLDVAKMTDMCARILQIAFSDEFTNCIPKPVRFIVQQIFRLSILYGFGDFCYMLTGNMLVLRCLCPMISVPEYYELSAKGMPSGMARKSLVLQGKLLSNIANFSQGIDFELDEQLVLYKDFIKTNALKYRQWVDKVIDVDCEEFGVVLFHKDGGHEASPSTSGQGLFPIQSVTNSRESTLSPSEIIRRELQQNSRLRTDPKQIPLRVLASIHRALIDHKAQIYDVVQAMASGETEMTATFPLEVQQQKFSRLLQQYARLNSLQSTSILNTMNKLVILLQTPPPVGEEADYTIYDPAIAVPKYYSVIKQNSAGKQQRRIVKFTTCSLLNIDGDMNTINGLTEVAKKSKVVVKNELTAPNIQQVKIATDDPIIELRIDHDSAEPSRIYICENKLIRNQILGELFEICYWNGTKQLDFNAIQAGQQIQLKLCRDGLLKISNSKVTGDYSYARLRIEFKAGGLVVKFKTGEEEIIEIYEMEAGEAERLIKGVGVLSGFKMDQEPDIDKM